jgi:endonuclease YncB( thermonuclease family)
MVIPLRFLVLGLLVATACAMQAPPPPKVKPSADPCGDARTVNQGYEGLTGKIVGVEDAVTLLVAVDNRYLPPSFKPALYCSPAGCRVRLVNLDAPAIHSAEASSKLGALVKKRVGLSISPVQSTDGALNALVDVDLRDLNEEQLAAGLATYRDFGPYAVDWYVECRLKRAQEKAKVDHHGVWSQTQKE